MLIVTIDLRADPSADNFVQANLARIKQGRQLRRCNWKLHGVTYYLSINLIVINSKLRESVHSGQPERAEELQGPLKDKGGPVGRPFPHSVPYAD